MSSYILLAQDIQSAISELEDELKDSRIIPFYRDEFKVEDAKAVIAEAYIAESQNKYILLASSRFNETSQNMLLKILEEPPRNIIFILIAKNKNSLLPTIRSRLPIRYKKTLQDEQSLGLELRRLSFNDIFEFSKTHQYAKQDEAKELVERIFDQAIKEGVKLSAKELEDFDIAIKSIRLNGNTRAILLNLLLGVMGAS